MIFFWPWIRVQSSFCSTDRVIASRWLGFRNLVIAIGSLLRSSLFLYYWFAPWVCVPCSVLSVVQKIENKNSFLTELVGKKTHWEKKKQTRLHITNNKKTKKKNNRNYRIWFTGRAERDGLSNFWKSRWWLAHCNAPNSRLIVVRFVK